eukprot:scaffold48051_cov43-Cyclotella_meneghiniana.AAC.7
MTPLFSPCHYPTDDLIFGSGRNVVIVSTTQQIKPPVKPTRQCTLDDEQIQLSNGRWVRYPFPDETFCPPMRPDILPGFRNFIPKYTGDMPISCWHRDDLSKLGILCGEMHCSETVNHRYITSLNQETKWNGSWESYNCVYHDTTNDEIQECVSKKNISNIDVMGKSISNILKLYLSQRIQNITLANDAPGSKKVILDSLQMPHLIWGKNQEEYLSHLSSLPNVTEDVEHYFVTGFYYTSEREPHVQIDRSLAYSQMAWEILLPKGYKMLNAFDVTAAFSFDTAGQFDGLHILGPPIRTIVTKLFHHLCLK